MSALGEWIKNNLEAVPPEIRSLLPNVEDSAQQSASMTSHGEPVDLPTSPQHTSDSDTQETQGKTQIVHVEIEG